VRRPAFRALPASFTNVDQALRVLKKEDATGRHLPRDEAPKVLLEAIGENGARKKRSNPSGT
jgi:hypothetical protein